MKSYLYIGAILIISTFTHCCSHGPSRTAEIDRGEIVGVWRGQITDPEKPTMNIWEQPCWAIDRNPNGTYKVIEYLVDHEKKLYTAIADAMEGEWKLEGTVLHQRTAGEPTWRKYEIRLDQGILAMTDPESGGFITEERIDLMTLGYSNIYRNVTNEDFERR